MTYGITTITMHPTTRTEYQTVLLPVWICPGGMKLRMNASNEPANPTTPITHIRPLPFPSLNGRGVSFILYRSTIAAANMSMYIMR